MSTVHLAKTILALEDLNIYQNSVVIFDHGYCGTSRKSWKPANLGFPGSDTRVIVAQLFSAYRKQTMSADSFHHSWSVCKVIYVILFLGNDITSLIESGLIETSLSPMIFISPL